MAAKPSSKASIGKAHTNPEEATTTLAFCPGGLTERKSSSRVTFISAALPALQLSHSLDFGLVVVGTVAKVQPLRLNSTRLVRELSPNCRQEDVEWGFITTN